MPTSRPWYRTAVTVLAATLVLLLFVVGLPLLGLAALVLRAGVVAGFGLALVGGILAYATSPRFRVWFGAQFEPLLFHKGLRLGADVAVHPGHTWARVRRGYAVVGADDLVQATLGPVDTVTLPPAGSRIRRGQPLFGLRQGDRTVQLSAPVSGTVVDHNTSLQHRPRLMNEDPYGKGWVLKLQGEDLRRERRRLRVGDQARVWFGREVDRLIGALLGDDEVVALADGGRLVDELHCHVDDQTWDRLKHDFFEVESRQP
jgi:glycine cleavage system H lipoate-binding protein